MALGSLFHTIHSSTLFEKPENTNQNFVQAVGVSRCKVILDLSCYNITTVLWVGLCYITLDYVMIILCSKNWSGGVMTGDLVGGNQTVTRGYSFHLLWYQS
jgi:hypothetical protein